MCRVVRWEFCSSLGGDCCFWWEEEERGFVAGLGASVDWVSVDGGGLVVCADDAAVVSGSKLLKVEVSGVCWSMLSSADGFDRILGICSADDPAYFLLEPPSSSSAGDVMRAAVVRMYCRKGFSESCMLSLEKIRLILTKFDADSLFEILFNVRRA